MILNQKWQSVCLQVQTCQTGNMFCLLLTLIVTKYFLINLTIIKNSFCCFFFFVIKQNCFCFLFFFVQIALFFCFNFLCQQIKTFIS
ncbi:unnamed protein product, partial [Brassica rapa subsp. trilocularis]